MMEEFGTDSRESASKRWNPYVSHGGTALGVIGENFVVIATDTRLSAHYSISCRHKTRIFQMTSKCMIVATGFQGDVEAFITRMYGIISNYRQDHFAEISTESVAHCVSNVLYSRRFFPYYVNILVGGMGKNGEGLLYGYDPVGTIESHKYDVNGSGCSLATPILDAVFGTIHHNTRPFPYPTLDDAKNILRDAISSAAERDIYTGDAVQIASFTADGLVIEEFPLPQH
jgi:20S proteasome subunit beta 6